MLEPRLVVPGRVVVAPRLSRFHQAARFKPKGFSLTAFSPNQLVVVVDQAVTLSAVPLQEEVSA